MITRDNLKDIIAELSDKEKSEIKDTDCEYVIISAAFFNVGVSVTSKCCNDLPFDIDEDTASGNVVVLYSSEVIEMLGGNEDA